MIAEPLASGRLAITDEMYLSLAEAGLLDGLPVELIAGEILYEMPQGPLHEFAIEALAEVFGRLGAFAHRLVPQPTVRVGGKDVFDPEYARFVTPRTSARTRLASEADFVMEVAVSSHDRDLGPKLAAYARNGVATYWVLDVPARRLIVHTQPQGDRYRSVEEFGEGSEVSVPGLPGAFRVGEVLPPA